jgi:hypothetical protein
MPLDCACQFGRGDASEPGAKLLEIHPMCREHHDKIRYGAIVTHELSGWSFKQWVGMHDAPTRLMLVAHLTGTFLRRENDGNVVVCQHQFTDNVPMGQL